MRVSPARGAQMKAKSAEPTEQLLPFVRKFVGSSGGGQWSFQVLCSVRGCRRQDTVSAAPRRLGSERTAARRAAPWSNRGGD